MFLSSVHTTLKSAFSSLSAERDRLRHTMDLQVPQPAQVIGLKTTYASVSQNTSVLHGYTTNIHQCTCLTVFLSFYQECPSGSQSLVHQASNESRASIPESISEFFDAQEYLLSSSSSENEVGHYLLHPSSSLGFKKMQ